MNVVTLSAKSCMNQLLLTDTFDSFQFIEGDITTFNTFHIDGFLHKEFYEEAPDETYSRWKDVREYCLSLMRGKRTPLNFKIILSLCPADIEAFLTREGIQGYSAADITGLYLNFRFDGETLTCVTGISEKKFSLDKTLEQAWDAYVEKFLNAIGDTSN